MAVKQTSDKSKPKKKPARSGKNKKNDKKKSPVPFLLLIILVLLGFIAYTYRDKLQVVLQAGKTQFAGMQKTGRTTDKAQKHSQDKKQNPLQKAMSKLDRQTTTTTTTTLAVKPKTTTTTVRKVPAATTTTVRPKSTTTTTTTTVRKVTTTTTTVRPKTTTTTTVAKPAKAAPKETAKTRTSKVYFTKITLDDAYLVAAERTVTYTDSPLTETIKSLLRGTTNAEDLQDIVTNIPDNTRLKAARIKNNIAYLDFSEEFENNYYGKESTLYQLKQIVYTATEFNGVDAVQILINGRTQDYLGGEGILIGEPLRRQDFR